MKLSDNTSLPELPVWQARSFWVQMLLALSVILNTWGVDLFRVLADLGLGGTPDEVLASGERAIGAWQQLAPLVLGLWAWVERRAPNYRLVFWPKVKIGILGIGLAACLSLFMAGSGQAQQRPPCAPLEKLRVHLAERFGEAVLWSGLAADGSLLSVYATMDGTSWSALVVIPDGTACLVGSGAESVLAAPMAPIVPGEDG